MSSTPANWYPDPMGRYQVRYWDGTNWTEHVSTNGVTALDPIHPVAPQASQAVPAATTVEPTPAAQQYAQTEAQLQQFVQPAVATEPQPQQYTQPMPTEARPVVMPSATPDKIQAQVQGDGIRGAGVAQTGTGGGTLFSEPVLVVNQKAKIFEVTNQYAVFDGAGRQIASVNEVGQSAAKKVLRVVSNLDQFMTHKLEIRDNAGQLWMSITRPRKVFKSTVVVENPQGQEIGRIVQENMIGKIHFGLESGGQPVGSIRAENWRAWNFSIQDNAGTEVARITKTFEGVLKTMFTTADNYVLQIHYELPQPLLSLVVASALSVDTALKQDSR
jgi:uncharacterized protein YxjI